MTSKADNSLSKQPAKVRESGVELLRLMAILGVVFIHFSERSLSVLAKVDNIGSFQTVLFLRSLFSSSVDVFLIISGYFMVKSNTRTAGKPLDLIWQVCFYQGLFYVVLAILGREPFGLSHIMVAAIPDCYYATLFVVVYLISPYINKVLVQLSQKELMRYMVVVLVLFSIFSTASTFFNELSNKQWMGLNTIGAWGSQQGFNIVNFLLCYCVGAFIRLYELPDGLMKTNTLWMILVVATLLIFAWAEVNQKMARFGMRSAWVYDNPLVIVQGAALFLLARKITFKSKFVNIMAQAVFSMFVIHCLLIWFFDIESLCAKPWYILIGGYLLFAIGSFAISFVVYYVYRGLFKPLFDKLDRIKIGYFENN